jgi:signal transduction histidine kinase
LNTLVQEVVDDLEEQIKKENATVKLSVLHDLEGDRVQVRQLFQNIIANALKFRKENRPPVVQVHSRLTDDGMCEIMVEDNGIGFDEKYLARIFTPFERLHPSSKYEGTGIGLATCSSIAARHGGEITARSVPGKGSVFIVKLPSHQVAKTRKKG